MKFIKFILPCLCALALTAPLTSCSTLSLKKPEVQVERIELGKTSLLGQDFKVVLRVQNPNNIALNAKGLYFELSTGGQKLATGVSDQAIAIPAMNEGLLPVTVHTSILDWLNVIGNAANSDNKLINYQIDGYLDGLDGWGRIPFSRKGEWKVPQ